MVNVSCPTEQKKEIGKLFDSNNNNICNCWFSITCDTGLDILYQKDKRGVSLSNITYILTRLGCIIWKNSHSHRSFSCWDTNKVGDEREHFAITSFDSDCESSLSLQRITNQKSFIAVHYDSLFLVHMMWLVKITYIFFSGTMASLKPSQCLPISGQEEE